MKTNGLDSFSVEIKSHPYTGEPQYAVYGYGVYEQGSVLAGQRRKVFIEWCESQEEAQTKSRQLNATVPPVFLVVEPARTYEDEDVSLEELSGLPSCPPKWFDPADAGERWDSDY